MSLDDGETTRGGFGYTHQAQMIGNAIRQRGRIVIVIGQRAVGKTSLLHHLMAVGNEEGYQAVYLDPYAGNLYDAFRQAIKEETPEARLILIDDAHDRAAAGLLDVLKIATERGYSVVLASHRKSFATDIERLLPALQDRIDVFHLGPWENSEIAGLLRVQFGDQLTDSQIQEIIAYAGGSPLAAMIAGKRFNASQDNTQSTPFILDQKPEPLELIIEPGDASADDLARLYAALSDLYRAYGGAGIVFDPEANSVDVQAGWTA